jgi:acyl carrier protein
MYSILGLKMDKRLATTLAQVFSIRVSDIHLDLNKADVGSWDSLKQMDLVVSLETEFRVELEIPDILSMTSVYAITKVLKAKGVTLED